ncbi:MAG: bifunctional diaminohydroxyphosphoribosylaminopyrimidine deaminase/5-amino-6-(5-phosphoribosylamino)uracil reductase RibD [Chryseosolibacter sp.]
MASKSVANWMDFPKSHSHEAYMRRALELAYYGRGNVSPNPLVGCVIVHDGNIIGEGWHKKYGEAHAEVNAIASVADKNLLKESTLYVNLEPCSHQGKTPPCADLVIHHQLQKVVIANRDINPLVAGNGIQKLQHAGITVITDVLSKEAYDLNSRFFTYMQKRRPHIILKWAETADGFIARKNNDSRWISDAYSRQLVHKWRSEEDAVLVGSGTAWYDNPMLNVRDWSGRDPVRILIDRHLKVGRNQNLFNGKQKTICYNLVKEEAHPNLLYVLLKPEHFLESLIGDLYKRGIQSVIVEGGGQILNSFINLKLWDEARIFISPQQFKTGIPAPRLTGCLAETQKLDHDWLKIIQPSA